jgi:deoxyribodipyrimidine photolyase-related protein
MAGSRLCEHFEGMEVTLVYPHQLFDPHPAVRMGRPVYLMEEPLFFGTDPRWPMPMHKQKLVLHIASMSAYAVELREMGIEVRWGRLPGGVASMGLLESVMPKELTELHVADVIDDVLGRRIRRFAEGRGIRLVVYENPNFLSPDEFLENQIGRKKKPFMARFYEAQRKRMGILLDDAGGPVGGRWSFDEDNRKKWPKNATPPAEPCVPRNDFVEDAVRRVEGEFAQHPGTAEGFRWAVTRADAKQWMRDFFERRFADFGPYEDAIVTKHAFLHHSAFTPMLNIGLLNPGEVVDTALRMGEKHAVPLASVEGFIRQLIGWREFIRGIYQFRSVPVRTRNFWSFDRPIPRSFYDGSTGIAPVDRVIRTVLKEGYCHHIERLMILGNFMLLCRFAPDAVYRWFMEMFVDSYDWVMVPNVYGMSQFADGGTFTTKPYLSGSNYILKMSDEVKGDWCVTWDALFWIFIADHPEFFLSNPRLSMMARTWEKMSREKQEGHRLVAERYLASLDG